MREIITTTRFERRLVRFARQHPDFKIAIRSLMLHIAGGGSTSNIHPLHGQMKGAYAARISQSYRLVFVLEPEAVVFIDIGSHDEVY